MFVGLNMTETQRKNLPFFIDGGIIVLLLTLIWQSAAWKTQIDEQMNAQRAEINRIAAITITPEANRRVSVVESQIANQGRDITEMKADLVRRLERQDAKLDAIAVRIDKLRNGH